jgi:hypothetical protein
LAKNSPPSRVTATFSTPFSTFASPLPSPGWNDQALLSNATGASNVPSANCSSRRGSFFHAHAAWSAAASAYAACSQLFHWRQSSEA